MKCYLNISYAYVETIYCRELVKSGKYPTTTAMFAVIIKNQFCRKDITHPYIANLTAF